MSTDFAKNEAQDDEKRVPSLLPGRDKPAGHVERETVMKHCLV